ncbi:MAG: glycosyltransferase [Bacillota bacterium]
MEIRAWLATIISTLGAFVFLYPLAMGILWTVGGLAFWWYRERERRPRWPPEWPSLTILIPCHNEAHTIDVVCTHLAPVQYPRLKVLFIDDASVDATTARIRQHLADQPWFHLLRVEKNQGKAGALNLALRLVQTPLVMVLDADTLLAAEALQWMAAPFVCQSRLGAVTANPIPWNRRGFWGRFQTAEFAAIFGLIKRTQRVWGKVLTVSGCATMFRTEALREVGGFSTATATEDIDITWRLQRAGYEVWFEPEAVAYIQVPMGLADYLKQRRRWATGGWHLLRLHRSVFSQWRWRRLWPVYLDFVLGYFWAFCFVTMTVLWTIAVVLGEPLLVASPFPAWHGAVLSLVCVTQMTVAALINNRYDPGLIDCLFWIPWYPLLFFAFSAVQVVITAGSGLFGDLAESGRWQSPDRESGY